MSGITSYRINPVSGSVVSVPSSMYSLKYLVNFLRAAFKL